MSDSITTVTIHSHSELEGLGEGTWLLPSSPGFPPPFSVISVPQSIVAVQEIRELQGMLGVIVSACRRS